MRTSITAGVAAIVVCSFATTADAGEVYTIDNAHTHITWRVDRFGFTKTVASFADVDGSLILDEEAPQNSSVSAEIDVASVKSDLREREDVIRSAFWLDAAQFPKIRFQSTVVELIEGEGDGRIARVRGDATIHGVSAPIEMIVKLNKIGLDPVTKRKAAGFSAKGALSRKAFGVETALGPIGDEVSFKIEALGVAETD